jgi:hypothetical protein
MFDLLMVVFSGAKESERKPRPLVRLLIRVMLISSNMNGYAGKRRDQDPSVCMDAL